MASKKTRGICLIACLVLAVTAACSSGNAGPSFDQADQDRIKAAIQQLTEAFNAKDAAKAAALYTAEAVVMPPNKTLSRGRSCVEQYYSSRFAEGAGGLTLQPGEIKGSGNLGVAMGDHLQQRLRRAAAGLGHRSAARAPFRMFTSP